MGENGRNTIFWLFLATLRCSARKIGVCHTSKETCASKDKENISTKKMPYRLYNAPSKRCWSLKNRGSANFTKWFCSFKYMMFIYKPHAPLQFGCSQEHLLITEYLENQTHGIHIVSSICRANANPHPRCTLLQTNPLLLKNLTSKSVCLSYKHTWNIKPLQNS